MNINWYGPINNLGYGVASTNLIVELHKLGNQVSLFPLNPQNVEHHEKYTDILRECVKNAMFYDCLAPTVKVWHQWDMALSVGKGPKIGFPIFELNKLTELEKHHLNSLDKIIVCSEWAKRILHENYVSTPKVVVPLGVDLNIFKRIDNAKQNNFYSSKIYKTIFLNVGKWEYRKGHDVIIECFNKAFHVSDNVELWMCNTNPFLKPEQEKAWHNLYKDSKLGNKVKLIPRQETQEQLAHLMSKASCGIFPARAEGWNLEVLELMALDIPSIVTNYSGHTEFCNDSNSFLVDIYNIEEADDGIWFKPGSIVNQGEWAQIDDKVKDNIIENMRLVHKKYQEGESLKTGCLTTAKEYTWSNAAKTLATYL